jgi:hypothetical protein
MQTRGTAPEFHDNTQSEDTEHGRQILRTEDEQEQQQIRLHVGRKGRMSGNHKQARGSK